LVVVEIGMRVFDIPPEYSGLAFECESFDSEYAVKDADIFWKLKPGLKEFYTNDLFLRGWAPRGERGDRDLRIACVGDSMTFGFGVEYEETYGMQLEIALRRRLPHARVESVLAGLPAYTTHQNRVHFRRDIMPLRPDLTVLWCGAWNDYYFAAEGKHDSDFAADVEKMRSSALRSLRIVRLIREAASRLESDTEYPPMHRVPVAEFKANIHALIDMARECGEVVAVVPAIPVDTQKRWPFGETYRKAAIEVYEQREVSFVDAAVVFADAGEPPVFLDFIHPSPHGYLLIVRELVRRIFDLDPPRLRELQSLRADPGVQCTGVRPARIEAGDRGQKVVIEGAGFARPHSFDRIWVGDRWVRTFEILGDNEVSFTLPKDIAKRTGSHPVVLVTDRGSILCPESIEIFEVAR